eukprot:scaffold3100_cov73-Phaeocystis_antarctica.AAC.1
MSVVAGSWIGWVWWLAAGPHPKGGRTLTCTRRGSWPWSAHPPNPWTSRWRPWHPNPNPNPNPNPYP